MYKHQTTDVEILDSVQKKQRTSKKKRTRLSSTNAELLGPLFNTSNREPFTESPYLISKTTLEEPWSIHLLYRTDYMFSGLHQWVFLPSPRSSINTLSESRETTLTILLCVLDGNLCTSFGHSNDGNEIVGDEPVEDHSKCRVVTQVENTTDIFFSLTICIFLYTSFINNESPILTSETSV